MILKYDEALNKSLNPEWFKNTYKREEICSDEQVDKINELVNLVGENYLFDYFCIKEDMFLQEEYYLDLMDYLLEIKESKN